MKRRLSSFGAVAAAVAILIIGSSACAQPTASSIGVQFVRLATPCCIDACGNCCSCPWDSRLCCIDGKYQLVPSDVTGAPKYLAANWNVAEGHGGVLLNLMNSEGLVTEASLLWEANANTDNQNTDNFMFKDPDRKLMSGYLDQNTPTPSPTFIQITGIPDDVAKSYDVVIYTLTTVPNFGGQYTVITVSGSEQQKFVLAGGNGVLNGPDFVEASRSGGSDPMFGTSEWGNFVVFPGLSGNAVTITATNQPGGKAPVNGVQIVSAP
jgi:hypothetical protein